jgi:tetratricopeptide (TPR) repeat protein
MHKAEALVTLRRDEEAVYEWSRALSRDPELAQALLGRARCYIRLGLWDEALSDLELASNWAHADPRMQIRIMITYAKCLDARPQQLDRWISLLRRTARQGRDLLTGTSAASALP